MHIVTELVLNRLRTIRRATIIKYWHNAALELFRYMAFHKI